METLSAEPGRGVGIIGGGTAGYLAALTLRAFHPDLEITLIDSSAIPIIGVGEATTSEIIPFLHILLGFDPAEFYRKLIPTWKLGIKFLWGPPQVPFFNYPFDRGPLLDAIIFEGHARNSTLNSALMTEDRVPLITGEATPVSLLPNVPFAYHLDNGRFVDFLKEKATARNIRTIDKSVEDVVVSPDGESIRHLVSSDGQILQFEFYVDCTGFRSLLLEKALRSPFQSYDASLLTDCAVVANAPHDGAIKPYTTAETMDHGWCWTIPQMDEDHLGYVFASAFCSSEQALSELRQKTTGLHDVRLLKFRSGRHQHFVKGNVAAIGNSYGFVEPLESTGIFVICRECMLLAQSLRDARVPASSQNFLNKTVSEIWDYIRWFLAVHFKFNDRKPTPFWRECRAKVDVSGASRVLELYKCGAPLSYRNVFEGPGGGHNFDAFGYDVLLLGQAVPAQFAPTRQDREQYLDYARKIRTLTSKAMAQEAAIEVLLRRPEMLAAMPGENSWASSLSKTMLRACSEQGVQERPEFDEPSVPGSSQHIDPGPYDGDSVLQQIDNISTSLVAGGVNPDVTRVYRSPR